MWTGVVLQGREDRSEWVELVRITYSNDGKIWFNVDNGKVYPASSNRNEKNIILF